MSIVVKEFKRLSPYESLFVPINRTAKRMAKLLGKELLSNADLYILQKTGYKIRQVKHTQIGKIL